jgi:hypothetical protein
MINEMQTSAILMEKRMKLFGIVCILCGGIGFEVRNGKEN